MITPELPLDHSRYIWKEETVAREVESLKPYPFISIMIPGLADKEYTGLLDSVRANGVKSTEPLTVTPEGLVVDGRARLRAAKQAGLHAVPTQVLEAPSEADYALWAARKNLDRRHLTPEARFVLIQAGLAIIEQRARASQRATQFRRKTEKTLKPSESISTRNSEGPTVGLNLDRPPKFGRSREQAGRRLGVSPAHAAKMITIAKHGSPEIKKAVAAGTLSIHRAYKDLQSQQPHDGRPLPRARPRVPAPDTFSKAMADQPVRTLRTVGALIPQWLEELPTWSQERQEQFWRALQDSSDSHDMAFQRKAQMQGEA